VPHDSTRLPRLLGRINNVKDKMIRRRLCVRYQHNRWSFTRVSLRSVFRGVNYCGGLRPSCLVMWSIIAPSMIIYRSSGTAGGAMSGL